MKKNPSQQKQCVSFHKRIGARSLVRAGVQAVPKERRLRTQQTTKKAPPSGDNKNRTYAQWPRIPRIW